jgi:hypothetical protein
VSITTGSRRFCPTGEMPPATYPVARSPAVMGARWAYHDDVVRMPVALRHRLQAAGRTADLFTDDAITGPVPQSRWKSQNRRSTVLRYAPPWTALYRSSGRLGAAQVASPPVARPPPGEITEQRHRRRDEQTADDGRVDSDRDRHSGAEHLDRRVVVRHE